MSKLLECPVLTLLGSFARPCLASAIMLLACTLVTTDARSVLLTLVVKVGVGAAAYVAASFALWRLWGRPDGGEQLVVEQLVQLRNAMAAR
jgi:hypothetical protein